MALKAITNAPHSGFGQIAPAATLSRVPPVHAARYPSFNRVLTVPPRCADRGKLTLQSNSPFSRCAEVGATPSGTARIGSGSKTVTTVPSSLRRRVIVDEQRWQSQKYSTRLDLDERSAGSLSRRKSLPSSRQRNEAEHEALVHLASITILPKTQDAGIVGSLRERPCRCHRLACCW